MFFALKTLVDEPTDKGREGGADGTMPISMGGP